MDCGWRIYFADESAEGSDASKKKEQGIALLQIFAITISSSERVAPRLTKSSQDLDRERLNSHIVLVLPH
jgi:hypothetical protein